MKTWLFSLLMIGLSTSAEDADLREITVLATEYPPQLSASLPGNGIAFERLRDFMRTNDIKATVKARFLPTIRIGRAIQEGDWCFSFYPPDRALKKESQFPYVAITQDSVSVGLIRKKENSSFTWASLDDFKDKRIAWLRGRRSIGTAKKLEEAGAVMIYVDSEESVLRLIDNGRVEFGVGNTMVFQPEMVGYPYKDRLELSTTAFRTFKLGIFVNPSCDEAEVFNGFM